MEDVAEKVNGEESKGEGKRKQKGKGKGGRCSECGMFSCR